MFVELLMVHECYLPIAEKLDIPVIGTVTLHSLMLADQILGVLNNPAVLPAEFSRVKVEMGFVERVQNLWIHFLIDLGMMEGRQRIAEFYREYFPQYVFHKKEISLVFFNNHATLLPRPNIPNAIDIGGVHVPPPNPLPEVHRLPSVFTHFFYQTE